ncbi:MAG: ABC transporter substrate-binding protein [Deltaproteobacteria bacterium]|nr:ABC transporter substrate-binding protein [Deltaproteobacteria bacterium]MBW2110090.1 ABC transporter substrate-binding protein [Deltaproteobacteria bacterium]
MTRRILNSGIFFLALILVAGLMVSGSPVRAAEKVVIGVLCPLTGPYSFEAKSEANFARLAAEEINAAGGVMGRKIEIVVEDTMLKPGIGVQKARKLMDKGVKYLTGGVSSSVVLAISKAANEAGVLHMGIGGSNALTGKYCNKHHFNLDTAAYQMATGTGSIVVDKLGLPKDWYCITADYTWGHTCLDSVKKMLEKRGGKVVGNIMVPIREQDFSSALTKAAASGASVLGVIVYGTGQGKLLQQAHEFGLKKKMKIVVVASDLTIATVTGGTAIEGVYLGMPWYWDLQNPVTIALNKKYVAKYGQPSAWTGAQAYDSVRVMAMAMEKARSFDVAKLIPVLEGMEFQTSKGPEKIRACDHRAIQQYFVGIGKAPGEMKGKWDVMKVIGEIGGEGIMYTCAETGCDMK